MKLLKELFLRNKRTPFASRRFPIQSWNLQAGVGGRESFIESLETASDPSLFTTQTEPMAGFSTRQFPKQKFPGTAALDLKKSGMDLAFPLY